MNTVVISGNLGRKPEFVETKGDTVVARMSIADQVYRQGETQTQWLTVTLFGKNAENAVKVLDTGCAVTVVGHLNKRTWQTDDGQDRMMLDVVADRWQLLSRGRNGGGESEEDGYGF